MRNIQLTKALTFNVPPIEDWVDQLPKTQSWDTLPKKQNIVRGVWDGTYHTGLRNPEVIDTIVIHHSGPPEGALASHARYHAKLWGAGIAYHIGIDENIIKQLNNLLSFTFHAGGHNTYTVAILINADLSKRDITALERELLYAAILTVKELLPIKYIVGHNEVPDNKTACPCTLMSRIRDDIFSLEQKMIFEQSDANTKETAFKIANQTMYLYNMAQGKLPDGSRAEEGQINWSVDMLLRLYPFMQENKLFG